MDTVYHYKLEWYKDGKFAGASLFKSRHELIARAVTLRSRGFDIQEFYLDN